MYTDRDLDTLARTAYGEARNETPEGIAAVAWVIKNRANDPAKTYGQDIVEVCLKPLQFSCWNTNDKNRISMMRASGGPAYFKVLGICSSVLAGIISDPTKGANHYFADYITPPKWADPNKKTVKIGVHTFYKL